MFTHSAMLLAFADSYREGGEMQEDDAEWYLSSSSIDVSRHQIEIDIEPNDKVPSGAALLLLYGRPLKMQCLCEYH